MTNNTGIFISIIIVSYNSDSYLNTCLEAIENKLKGFKYEVIIVDNASVPPVGNWEEFYPNVKLIRNQTNVGFALGNNIGMKLAKGDVIWLLNPDTILLESCVQYAFECFKSPEVGIVGNRLFNADGTIQKSVFEQPKLLTETLRIFGIPSIVNSFANKHSKSKSSVFKDRLYGAAALSKIDEPTEVWAVLGASMMLRRTMLNEIGLFDPRYFMFQEEADLCFRANRQGWKIIYCPQSHVIHYGGHSTWENAGVLYEERFRSLLLYFSLYYSTFHVIVYRIVLFLTGLVRTFLLPTKIYKMDLGMGVYSSKDREIKFTRFMALQTYLKLMLLAFSSLPEQIDIN